MDHSLQSQKQSQRPPKRSATPLSWPNGFRMTRAEASALAKALGYPVAVATLAKLAVIGGGPEIVYFGRKPGYRVGAFKRWLSSKTTVASSTSDL